jgi:hypothetical protein
MASGGRRATERVKFTSSHYKTEKYKGKIEVDSTKTKWGGRKRWWTEARRHREPGLRVRKLSEEFQKFY